MPTPVFLGEFEQFVLLAILKRGNEPSAIEVREEMAAIAGREVARGALYRTLDRLEGKGYVRWRIEPGEAARAGLPKRRFTVTAAGVARLRAARSALTELWASVDGALE
ncbi:MAG: PadR family transcriptional regulator [Gemmatimonadales bacterium]